MKFLTGVLALFCSTVTLATTLNNVVVFGDSLSDVGNLYKEYHVPASPPYYEGRFSNGPLWIEQLLSLYFPNEADAKAHLENYAYGGAGVSIDDDPEDTMLTLNKEVRDYLKAHGDKANENDLYVVWIGANNYLNVLDELDDEALTAAVNDVVSPMRRDIEKLVAKGARHIMVVNAPDLGRVPLSRDTNLAEFWSKCTNRHNDILKSTIETLQGVYPEVQWLSFDVNYHLTELMDDHERYGFSNITDACYEPMAEVAQGNTVIQLAASLKNPKLVLNCDKYLFFDFVHPTTKAHKIMAEKTKQLLDDNEVSFS